MAYNFSTFDARTNDIVDWLSKEFSVIRTGQATPALFDGIQVDSYGAKVPMNQVANIGVEDARTLRISPWDASQLQAIEKALMDADLGVSVSSDDSGVRASFPELTSERRDQLIKVAKNKLEEARVSIRSARDDEMKKIEALQKEGVMSEDEKFGAKDSLQKKVDAANAKLEEQFTTKETEVAR